ncbi:MAG: hypothetical protein ACRCYY_17180 [Trueperaceae bacterium]
MPTEICSYRLNLRGKPIGSYVMSSSVRGRLIFLESKLVLQGSLGNVSVTQRSKFNRLEQHSVSFFEETVTRGETRQFSVQFDRETGVVRANKNGDVAEIPYTRSFLDPLSLLYRIRLLEDAAPEGERLQVRAPMIGKDVIVERIQTTSLTTALGKRDAYEYQLYPGGSYVYVDVAAPHHLLMLSQHVDGQLIDALIVRVDEEADALRDERRNRQQGRRRRPRPQGQRQQRRNN